MKWSRLELNPGNTFIKRTSRNRPLLCFLVDTKAFVASDSMSNENCGKSDVCGQEQTYQLDQLERSEPATVLISQTMCRHWISRSNLPDIGIRTSRSPPTKDSRFFLDTCVLCSSIYLYKFCFASIDVVSTTCSSEKLFSHSVITKIWFCVVGSSQAGIPAELITILTSYLYLEFCNLPLYFLLVIKKKPTIKNTSFYNT